MKSCSQPVAWVHVTKDGTREVIWQDARWFGLENGTLLYTSTPQELTQQWKRACMEIIDRCVAPDMYVVARAMLDKAESAALAAQTPSPPSAALREALTELVALKDLKERITAALPCLVGDEAEAVWADYERRKDPAWKRARAALAVDSGETQ